MLPAQFPITAVRQQQRCWLPVRTSGCPCFLAVARSGDGAATAVLHSKEGTRQASRERQRVAPRHLDGAELATAAAGLGEASPVGMGNAAHWLLSQPLMMRSRSVRSRLPAITGAHEAPSAPPEQALLRAATRGGFAPAAPACRRYMDGRTIGRQRDGPAKVNGDAAHQLHRTRRAGRVALRQGISALAFVCARRGVCRHE